MDGERGTADGVKETTGITVAAARADAVVPDMPFTETVRAVLDQDVL